MAFMEVNFFSDVLGMCMSMYVIVPQKTRGNIGVTEGNFDQTYPTLYLLHGMSDDHTIWMRRTSIERYAEARGIAVVMPTTYLGWYTDMKYGYNYRKFIGEELPKICRSFGVKPESIGFEINEGVLLQDLARAVAFTRRLRSKGFRFIVDEFGADASALRLLSDLRPDEVKLSRAFFADETDTRDGRFMVENLLRLCAQLHVSGVAQGVDSAAQAEYLMDAACDMVQGFSFFKPMALERFETEVFHGSALRLVDLPRSEKKPLTRLGGETANAPIVHFAFLSQEDRVEFDSAFSPILAGATSIDGARSLFRTSELIHENDRADFLLLLDRAQKEKGWLESTIRFYTNHSGYEWLQLRLHCADQRSGVISGTMVNVAGWIGEVDRWKEKATRDALTGLFNREHFERTLRAGVENSSLTSAALVFIDVDDFKNVNDSYGHMFGDDVLCYVAKRILGTFRHSDICARYGIPYDRAHIIGHEDYRPSKSDPGELFDWGRVLGGDKSPRGAFSACQRIEKLLK